MKFNYHAIVSILTSATALGLSGCASTLTMPDVPPTLAVPAGQMLSFEATATGVQIYECKEVSDSPMKFVWLFKAPEADLFDAGGNKIAHHYAGPTWEANDGSKVVGEIMQKFSSPDGSIPWLLLSAKSNSGKGVFAQTASIQRLSTNGGLTPQSTCDQTQAGQLARIPYTAIYAFYSGS